MQTEQEFLSQYSLADYERPSVTADIVCFMLRTVERESYRQNADHRLSVLLVRRAAHPFKDHWALPGGFLQPDETIETCALREAEEETSVVPVSLMPVGVFSEPGRDPRGWIISHAFASIISEDSVRQIGGDDAADAQWFDVQFEQQPDGNYRLGLQYADITLNAVLAEEETRFGRTSFRILDSGALAFDHARILATALTALRSSAERFDVIFDFLPETFTLSALQKVQETILNISVLPANFRRKISDHVVQTNEYTQGGGHRPAMLYRRKDRKELSS